MARADGSALLESTAHGLYCPCGGFHIDPWAPVERAIITHAHSDHLVAGCAHYLCAESGVGVLRERLGMEAAVTPLAFGVEVDERDVRVGLHPAGHILGSAQVSIRPRRSAPDHRVWVVSGDYKTEPDPTCRAFEPARCDVFITESTFGLPIYRWEPQQRVFDEINAWWRACAERSRTAMIFAYALGKAQRILAGVDPAIGPIAAHGAVHRFNEAYRSAGVALPAAPHAAGETVGIVRGRGLVIAPPSAIGSAWMRKFAGAGGISAGLASGWMQVRGARRRRAIDRGFVLSDHADWPGLLGAIGATGANSIGVTHGNVRPLVAWLRETGLDAFEVPTRYSGETAEDAADGAAEP